MKKTVLFMIINLMCCTCSAQETVTADEIESLIPWNVQMAVFPLDNYYVLYPKARVLLSLAGVSFYNHSAINGSFDGSDCDNRAETISNHLHKKLRGVPVLSVTGCFATMNEYVDCHRFCVAICEDGHFSIGNTHRLNDYDILYQGVL